MNQNIIIIGSGNHHNTLGVIRAIGRAGLGVDLVTYDNVKKNYIACSKYVTTHHMLSSKDDLFGYMNGLEVNGEKRIVISCADIVTECLNQHLDVLSKKYVLPGTPIQGHMLKLMDKTTMISMAAKHNIFALKVWHLPEDYNKVVFPCITKSYVSSHGGKTDIIICHSKNELDSFLKDNDDDIFVQSYINKIEEVQFIGCSLNGGDEIIIPGMTKVFRSQPNTNTGFLEYGPIDPFYDETVKNAKAYIKDCQYSGLFSIEFLRGQDNMVWFLEINFRNDGNAICVTEAGINLPLIWVKANRGEDYKKEIKTPKKIIVMPEFQDFKLVLQRKVGIWQWLKDWKRTDVFMEYASDDKRPFFQYIMDKIL